MSVVATRKIGVDVGDHLEHFSEGEIIEGVSQEMIDHMVAIGHAVEAEEICTDEDDQVVNTTTEEDDNTEGLPELCDLVKSKVLESLSQVGLNTTQEVLDYIAENETLEGIPGISKAAARGAMSVFHDLSN